MKNFEEILDAVGSFGRYQKRLYILFFFAGIPNALFVLHFIFTHHNFAFHCKLPQYAQDKLDKNETNYDALLNWSIPLEANEFGESRRSECLEYAEFFNNSNTVNETATKDCSGGWEYEMESYQSTAIADFNMVCKDDWKPNFVVSMYQLGVAFGSCLGFLSDKYGRRPLFLYATLGQILVMGITGLSWNFASYVIFTLMGGCTSLINYYVGFVLATEVTGMKKRNFIAISSFYSFALGYAIVAGLSYLIQKWRWYLFAISLISALQFPYYWLIPESPRWLITAGRKEEAKKELKRIAKMNGKNVNVEELLESFYDEKEDQATSARVGVISILCNSKIRARFLSLFYGWFVTVTLYFAVTLYSTDYSTNRFLNCLFPSFLEFLGYFLSYFLVKWIGRPRTMTLCMIVFCASSLILCFIPKDLLIVKSILALIGKAAGAAMFYAIFIITSELTPTMERNSILGIAAACTRVGGFIAPYLMYLVKVHYSFPYYVMAFLSSTSAILAYKFIPETKGVKMPDSTKDAEDNDRYYGWKFWINFEDVETTKETAAESVPLA